MIRFIGYYDYTVILTYVSLISSLFGLSQVFTGGNPYVAVGCLAVSGLCDAFDGRVARTKKNRTEDQRSFGIQLDSLCDVFCFGIYPGALCFWMGVNSIPGMILIALYCLCALIRLAFFNVLEANRQKEEGGGCNKHYRGLPVTSISFIFPVVFALMHLVNSTWGLVMLHVMLAVVALLFVADFKLRKPGLKGILIIAAIVTVVVCAIIALAKFVL